MPSLSFLPSLSAREGQGILKFLSSPPPPHPLHPHTHPHPKHTWTTSNMLRHDLLRGVSSSVEEEEEGLTGHSKHACLLPGRQAGRQERGQAVPDREKEEAFSIPPLLSSLSHCTPAVSGGEGSHHAWKNMLPIQRSLCL